MTLEDDGIVPDRPWKINGTVVIRGDELIVDFTGSDPQCFGPANQTFGTTASAAYNAVLHMVRSDIPYNHGCYRPISVIAPPGSFVNVSYPAACTGGNSDTHPTTVDILLKAFSQFSERSSAADGGTCGCIGFGGEDPRTREPYAHLHLEGVGWGGRDDADGNDAQFVKNGNCANTPVEVAETRYPFLNLEYQLEPGRVGHGRHRGGFGTRRIFRFLSDGVQISSHTNRHRVRAWGLFGGEDGTNTVIAFRRNGRDGVGARPRGVRLRLVRQVLGRRHERRATRCCSSRRRAAATAMPSSAIRRSCSSTGATSFCPRKTHGRSTAW